MFIITDRFRKPDDCGVKTCEITCENLYVIFHDKKHHTTPAKQGSAVNYKQKSKVVLIDKNTHQTLDCESVHTVDFVRLITYTCSIMPT